MNEQTSNDVPNESSRTWVYEQLADAKGFAERALSSPYQEGTVKLRNLLLGSTLGLGLWLLGMKAIQVHPLGKLLSESDPIVFHSLAILVQIYALLAYKLAADTDREIHRLRVLEPYKRVMDSFHKIQARIWKEQGDFSEYSDRLGPLLRAHEEMSARRDAFYSRILSKLTADPEDLDAEELSWKVCARLEREREGCSLAREESRSL